MESVPTRSRLAFRDLALAVVVFLLVVAAGNVLFRWLNSVHPIDLPRWWPLGVFHRREPVLTDFGFALAAWFAFESSLALRRSQRPGGWLLALVVAVVLASTAVQGVPRGFAQPIAGLAGNGEAIQYFHDRARFTDAFDLFARWNELQESLLPHSRTHPPGAVLATMLPGTPATIGLVWLIATTLAGAIAIRSIARSLGLAHADTAPLLFVALPAVQIYFGATIDAWVAACVLGALALLLTGRAVAGGVVFAIGALCSFGAWIAAPVLVVAELARHRSARRSTLLFIVSALTLIALRFVGLDYLQAFATATRLENPHGFQLFADPINYAATRIEDAAEIAFFLGPVLLLVLARGRRELDGALRWTWIATIASVGLAFLTGALKTGETARGCLFAAPLLALPALTAPPDERDLVRLLRATFAFGLLLQLFGDWFW